MRLIVPFSGRDRQKCMDFYLRNVNLGDRGFAPEAKAVYALDELEATREYQDALNDYYNYSILSVVLETVRESLDETSYNRVTRRIDSILKNINKTYYFDGDKWPDRFVDKFKQLKKQMENVETSHANLIKMLVEEILDYELDVVTWIEIDLNRRYIVIAGEQYD